MDVHIVNMIWVKILEYLTSVYWGSGMFLTVVTVHAKSTNAFPGGRPYDV